MLTYNPYVVPVTWWIISVSLNVRRVKLKAKYNNLYKAIGQIKIVTVEDNYICTLCLFFLLSKYLLSMGRNGCFKGGHNP